MMVAIETKDWSDSQNQADFSSIHLNYPKFSRGVSVVTRKIRPALNGSRVILTHDHLERYADAGIDFQAANYRLGWNQVLGKALKEFVEKDRASVLTEGLIEDN